MQDLYNIQGKYFLKEQDNSEFVNEFLLDLYQEKDRLKFNLEMVTSGKFGKFGKNWIGVSIFRSDHYALIIEQELDWVMLAEDNEKTVNESKHFESLPIEIYPNEQEQEIIVYHIKIERQLNLKRINEKIEI